MAQYSQAFLNRLGAPGLMEKSLMEAAGGLASLPQQLQESKAKDQAQKQLQQFSSDPTKLTTLGQEYAIQGNDELSKVFLDAAKVAEKRLAEQGLLARKGAVATRAESLKLTSVAAAARSALDHDTLDEIVKDLRAMEIKRAPSQTAGQRASRAAQAGIGSEEFASAGLADATDEFFESYVTGSEGKTEAWADRGGKIGAYRFNKAGKVYDEAIQKFVEPSELGLVQKAPQVQKVIDASDKLIEALADESVKDIVSLRDKARTAKAKVDVLNRQIARLDGGMPTGIAANIQVGLAQVGQLMGMPYNPNLVNAQEYMMEVANLVKQEIKAFGSGTSITDADREYTQRMVGGDITQQADALENMLQIYKRAAEDTVKQYNEVLAEVSSEVGSDNMGTFRSITLPKEPNSTELSPAALKYLTPKDGE